jgi:hypothetical protein
MDAVGQVAGMGGNQAVPGSSKGQIDDRQLARQAREGDHAAFSELVVRYSDRL